MSSNNSHSVRKRRKKGRFCFRLLVFLYCVRFFLLNLFKKRVRPMRPQSVLIAHHLLLGDTLMLTPMLARLRQCYPDAVIYFLVPESFAALYSRRPYNIRVLGYDPRSADSYLALRKASQSVDVAFVPGDNRFSNLAYSLQAEWIVAFNDLPENRAKNLFVDQFVAIPEQPCHWQAMNVMLVDAIAVEGMYLEPLPCFEKNDWPAPACDPFEMPGNFVVLHVGASSPLKYWPAENWRALADALTELGYQVVWTASPAEKGLIEAIDAKGQYLAYANLSLVQLWHLIERARLVICPDTGVAHLAKITETPVVVLFGQGSDVLFGCGEFFNRGRLYQAIIVDDMPCRDQNLLFKRPVPWVRRCNRGTSQCSDNVCMKNIAVDAVYQAALRFLAA